MEAPHSAAFFGAVRDFWWNLDQIEVFARRVGLEDARSVLDVGSGVGHWGRLLSHVLPPDATVVGIDTEPRWVEQAAARAADAGLEEIEACQSDKVSIMVPPYQGGDQQGLKEAYVADATSGGGWGWTRDEARRYYTAGGGDPAEFNGSWERRMEEARHLAAAV